MTIREGTEAAFANSFLPAVKAPSSKYRSRFHVNTFCKPVRRHGSLMGEPFSLVASYPRYFHLQNLFLTVVLYLLPAVKAPSSKYYIHTGRLLRLVFILVKIYVFQILEI